MVGDSMESYVEKQLHEGEQIQYRAKVHWIVYGKSAVIIFGGLIVLSVGGAPGVAVPFFILGITALVWAWMEQKGTELAITNKRVVAKFGIVRRQTYEQQLSHVDGTNLYQGILGRMLGYASISVRGAGGGSTPIPCIRNPVAFQRELGSWLS